jgi:AhpD family alkylhydroperoxidase
MEHVIIPPRFDANAQARPGLRHAMLNLPREVESSGLEHSLLELMKIRASQINGCAFCVDMHTKDARAAGEEEHRLYLLVAWRECDWYSDRERAALALAEAMTRLPDSHGVPDDVFGAAAEPEPATASAAEPETKPKRRRGIIKRLISADDD